MKNEPAFPFCVDNGETVKYHTGMTLRDYFAAKAMQAFIVKGITPADGLNTKQAIVSMAYETADEMLKERNQ
jgi:hypothetical protein